MNDLKIYVYPIISETKKREIILLRLAGHTVYEIAIRAKVSLSDVLRVLDKEASK